MISSRGSAGRQPIESEDALRSELGCKRELAQTGGVCRGEARRLDGKLVLAGPFEELQRTLGVGNDVRRAPLVRAQARPAHEQTPAVGRIRSAGKRPVDLTLAGVTFRGRRRTGGPVVQSVEVECHLAPGPVSAAARCNCIAGAGIERVSGRPAGQAVRGLGPSRAVESLCMHDEATFRVKAGLAEMLKGGVIMDVVTPEQAKVAEDAGACAVMALERVPADIRRDGGVARMSDPTMIRGIEEAVTIPVMAKARIGHFAEAQVLEALEVDYIDESEVLTPADEANHIDKWAFKVPFVCGATNLGEALRRIGEGAAMIRSKGEAGTGDIVEAVRHLRQITGEIRRLATLDPAELPAAAKSLQAPLDLVQEVARAGRLPVVMFCAGGIATPADASLVMQLGAEGVFVGSGIFKSEDPARRARAIVEATTHFADPERVASASEGLGGAMASLESRKLPEEQLLAPRGW